MKSKLSLALLALALVALAVPALSPAGRNTTVVEAKMKGKYDVPAGSRRARATIQISLKPTQSKLCFEFKVKKLDPIIDGAIHKGAEGEPAR